MLRLKCLQNGECIDLIEEIAKSGEARIYTTNKPGFLAKIYHSITPEKIMKLEVMVKNPPNDPTRNKNHISIAWPKDLLQDNYGKVLGFLMPAVQNGQTLINVYNPSRRKNNAPGFNWFYLHTTAMNLASIIDTIHAKKYVVGDLKPKNLLVTPNACVSIIDTDSFRIVDSNTGKIYRSPVASQEYTPPEMFGKDLQNVDRSEFQDRFGLAVIIWHLLFGYHPFSGKWQGSGEPLTIDKYIEKGYWMYGSNSQLRPSSHSIPLNIIHPQLQKLFRQCFDDGYKNILVRPSAAEWKQGLQVAIRELTQCSVESGHHYVKSFSQCYWCEKKRKFKGFDIFATPPGLSPSIVLPPQPFKTAIVPPLRFTYKQTNVVNPSPQKIKVLTPTKNEKIKTVLISGSILLGVFFIGFTLMNIKNKSENQANSKSQILSISKNAQSPPTLDPKQVVQKYYELAPSNREAAKALLSDAYKNWFKQNNEDSGAKSFWNTIDKVEVYNFKLLSQSPTTQNLKIWLKYFARNGEQSCESQKIKVVLDRNKSEWLIDEVGNIEQQYDCGL